MSDYIAVLVGAQVTCRLLSVFLRIVLDQVQNFRRLTISCQLIACLPLTTCLCLIVSLNQRASRLIFTSYDGNPNHRGIITVRTMCIQQTFTNVGSNSTSLIRIAMLVNLRVHTIKRSESRVDITILRNKICSSRSVDFYNTLVLYMEFEY